MKEKRWKIRPELSFREVLETTKDMTVSKKAVALFLAIREMEEKPATLKELEQEMNLGRATVERVMTALRQARLIVEA